MRGETFTPVPNRGMITMSIMLANIMQGVDNTILNVALPHVQGSLSASQWVDLGRPMLSRERPVSVAARPGECLLTERQRAFKRRGGNRPCASGGPREDGLRALALEVCC
jgi:hypothetical protein